MLEMSFYLSFNMLITLQRVEQTGFRALNFVCQINFVIADVELDTVARQKRRAEHKLFIVALLARIHKEDASARRNFSDNVRCFNSEDGVRCEDEREIGVTVDKPQIV